MNLISPSPRRALFVVNALLAAAAAGCFSERHLVGDLADDASVGPPKVDAGAGVDASSDSGLIGSLDAVDGPPGRPVEVDASTSAGTVVSLGDKAMLGWPIRIAPEEVARRLSLFILRRLPSERLTTAVVAAAPRTNEDVGQLADGLLLAEDSAAGREAFYRWWLDLDGFATTPIVAGLFPAFTSAVRSALVYQSIAFIEDVTWRPQGDLATLLTEPTAYVNAATAAWFPGVAAPLGAASVKVNLDPTRYAGLITQPAVVTPIMPFGNPSNSARGDRVFLKYLCQQIPQPPPNTTPPPTPEGTGTREWIEANVLSQPQCSACHRFFDPLGFAFGHFDAVGAFNETVGGLPVDTSGALQFQNLDLNFSGAPQLASQLAQAPEMKACFASAWLGFATGTFPTWNEYLSDVPTPSFAPSADYIVKRATVQGRLSLLGTIRAVTETHTFLD